MSDNIYNFPKGRLEVEVEFDDDSHQELVDAAHTMLEMHAAGMIQCSDVGWEHILDAAMTLGIGAGLRAGISPEELEDALADVVIEGIIYDA